MNKILFFLLIPLFSFGQNVQAKLKFFSNSTGTEITSEVAIEEGDTLRTEVHLVAVGSGDYTALSDARYLVLDIEYPTKILSPLTNAYAFPGIDAITNNAITELYEFDGKRLPSKNADLLGQFNSWQSGAIEYIDSDSYSVRRIAFQLADASIQDLLDANSLETVTPIFDFLSLVKPDASLEQVQVTYINGGNIELSNGDQITSFFASNGNAFGHKVEPATEYNVKLHFVLPESLDPTNFQVNVQKSYTGTDTVDQSNYQSELLTLDAAGDAMLLDVDLDTEYFVYDLEPINSSYIPDVHTITDAYRSFKYLNDVGINGGDTVYNNFGLFSADADLSGNFNSGDVYGLLGYVLGIDVGTGNAGPEGGYCLPEQVEGEWIHGCTAAVRYEFYTIEQLGAMVDLNRTDTEPSEGGGWDGSFIPTEDGLNFDFAFWHHVDLDQSHSTSFPANITAKAAKVGLNLSNKAVGTTKLDMVSKIEDGKVLVELNHNGTDMVGLQARIKYDTSKLQLQNIIFNTGNKVTNFSKHENGNLLFGGLSTDGSESIERGKAFVIEFTPIGTVNNVTGLFYFDNTDAVKENGDKLTLTIQ